MHKFVVAVLFLAGFAITSPALAQQGKSLVQVASIDLPGPAGKRFDYLITDDEDHYLLSGHLGAGILYVIDMRTNQLVQAIPDVPGVEGVEYVPELGKVYTSDWKENKIAVIDLRTMKVVKKLSTEDKPDGSTYAAPYHKLYVSDERGKAEAVVDVRTDTIVKTLHFESETGMPQYDPVSKMVLVNLQEQNVIAAINPVDDTVVARYPVSRCKGNHGMALDAPHRRAFLVCEESNELAIFDLTMHKTIGSIAIPDGGDVVKYDAGLQRVYVACYSGAIAVIHEDDADHYRKIEDFKVQAKVHSLAIDAATHRVYAPEEQENGKPSARMIVFEAKP